VVLAVVLLVGLAWVFVLAPHPRVVQPPPSSTRSSSQPIANRVTNSFAATPPPQANHLVFQERPFAVAFEGTTGQWTLEDGKDTNIIRQLAHNDLEFARMVEENSRIFRRQLVYLKETAAAILEQAKLTGEPVRQLTLPALDGQELKFEIVKTETQSSRHGMFSGHLAGDTDSLVTLAFQDGREAFTVLSPKQNLFVVAEPREPGQVIVKAINPNTYGGPAGGDDAIITSSTPK